MRIIICVSSMGSGGAERVAATLANAWTARGHDVVLMPLYSGRGECFYHILYPAKLHYLADLAGPLSSNFLFAYIQRLRVLRRYFLYSQPDVIVSFLSNVNIMTLLGSYGLGLRTIICERTDPFEMPVNISVKVLRAIFYPFASHLVVQTEAVAQKFLSLRRPIPPIAVIGNPIPEEFVTSGPNLPRHTPAPMRLLAVGRLSEEKRFDHLIHVFAALAYRHPTWTLRIVGEGPDRALLEALVSQLGIAGRVELPGRRTGIEKELKDADVFVLTSSYEGFPNALLEAMAVGLPCVTTDCPSGPSEITEQGRTALLVPVGDAAVLEKALDKLMSNPSLRQELGALAHRSVIGRFSLEQILERWNEVLLS